MAGTKHVEGCWAASLGDCRGKISREHYVSSCLFPSGKAIVKGFHWCREETKVIGIQSLTRNILCERHNNALSELDSAMLGFFNTLRESSKLTEIRSKLRQTRWKLHHFEVNGALLERWLLKTLINISFGQNLRFGDTQEPPGVPPKDLVLITFGESEFVGFAGMYISVRLGEQLGGLEGVSITTFTERGALVVAEFTVCGIRFLLSLVQEEVHEFRGAQLSRKSINFLFRVPGPNSQMVRSHFIHIR